MPPLIELIPIGTELILGRIADTNTQFLTREIKRVGGRVRRVTTVRDNPKNIIEAIREAIAGGVTHIVTTGGLGPTPDDMTVDTLAGMIGCGTVVNEGLVDHFRTKLNLGACEQVSDQMRKVATIPDVGTAAPNLLGWGHCITVPFGGITLFAMPGPPREVIALFPAYIKPILKAYNT
mgnify:FL=1